MGRKKPTNEELIDTLDLIWRKLHACNKDPLPRRVRDDVKILIEKTIGYKPGV